MHSYTRTTRRLAAPLLALLTLLMLAACTPADPTPAPTATTAASAATATTVPATPQPTLDANPAVPTPTAETITAGDIYTATSGLFSVPVPTNWQVDEANDIVTLTDKEGASTLYLLTLPTSDLAAALADGWKLADPAFALEPADTQEPPSAPGVERTLSALYDDGDPTHITIGMAQLHNDTAYLLLLRSNLEAVEKRSAQISIIQSGFTISGLEAVSLRSVQPKPVSPAITSALADFIEQNMTALGIPGVSVAIVQNDAVVYSAGFGVRAAGSSDPVNPQTLMMIGSTTKSMTTMLMATLVDTGNMTWDTPAVAILPTFRLQDPELSKQITMRNLVCACTGVPRRDVEWIFNADAMTPQTVVESLSDIELLTDFGEAFQYSNQMVATGGYLAGLAAGGTPETMQESYSQALQERVLDPIGMTSSTFAFDAVQASGNYALPHEQGFDTAAPFLPLPLTDERIVSSVAPAGGLWSNADDMARYLLTELNHGTTPAGVEVVSAANLATTWEPQVPIDATSTYGLGWMVTAYKDLPVIAHGGNTFGFTSDLAFLPEADLGIVVLANGRATNLFNEGVRTRLLELVFDQEPEAQVKIDFALTQSQAQSQELAAQFQPISDLSALEPFLGDYSHPALGAATLLIDGDQLIFDSGELRMVLVQHLDDQGAPDHLAIANTVLAGIDVYLRDASAGNPEVVIDVLSEEYVFTRK